VSTTVPKDTHETGAGFPGRDGRLRPWIVAAILLAVAAPWLNIPRDQADSAGMLAHLHAFFVGMDLLYDDEYAALGMSPLFAFVTHTGVVSNHWPMGATWLQIPGYMLGLGAARVLSAVDVASPSPLGVVPLLGVRTWAVLLVAAVAAGVARWVGGLVDRPTGVVVALALVFGTPLWYYASESPLRPHLYGAAVVLAAVWIWSHPTWGKPNGRALALGALFGLAACIRPQLAPLLLLAIHDGWQSSGRLRRLVLAVLAFLPWPLVLTRFQLWIYGADIATYGGHVSYHPWYFLFSSHHGALTWCPVLLLGLLGVALAVLRRERGAWLVLVLVLLQLWIDSGMRAIRVEQVLGTRTWAGGLAFGPRKLVDVLPLFVPGAIVLARAARERGLSRVLGWGTALLCLPTVLLHVAAFTDPQRATETIHDGTSLLHTMVVGPSPGALAAALASRALPLSVPFVTAVLVGVPLLAALVLGWRWLARLGPERTQQAVVMVVVGLGVAANLWLSVLQVRSATILEEDPQRMVRARARMLPAHIATVASIERHHAELRARLGDGAAPPIVYSGGSP
jgi:hypothetical protein